MGSGRNDIDKMFMYDFLENSKRVIVNHYG